MSSLFIHFLFFQTLSSGESRSLSHNIQCPQSMSPMPAPTPQSTGPSMNRIISQTFLAQFDSLFQRWIFFTFTHINTSGVKLCVNLTSFLFKNGLIILLFGAVHADDMDPCACPSLTDTPADIYGTGQDLTRQACQRAVLACTAKGLSSSSPQLK